MREEINITHALTAGTLVVVVRKYTNGVTEELNTTHTLTGGTLV